MHCYRGIPDKPGLRQTYWKLVVGVLPLDRSAWKKTEEDRYQLYCGYVQDLIINPTETYEQAESAQPKDVDHVSSPIWHQLTKAIEYRTRLTMEYLLQGSGFAS